MNPEFRNSLLQPRRPVLFVFFFFLFFSSLLAQSADTFSLLPAFSFPTNSRQIYSDHIGHIYLVTKKNELIKYELDGKELFRYSDLRYGQLSHVDLSNPMQILLFYSDFNYLVMLERTLTTSGSLNLQEAGFPIVSAIASAADGNMWLFDAFNSRLVKIDRRGRKILESPALPLVLGRRPEITHLKEAGENVYALENGRIQVFDLLGQWIREIRLPEAGLSFVNFSPGRLVLADREKVLIQSLTDPLNTKKRYLPAGLPEFMQITLTKDYLYFLTKKEVTAFFY